MEDFGKFWASSVGTDVGLLTRPGKDAMIPEEKVTTRKPFWLSVRKLTDDGIMPTYDYLK